MIKKKLKRIFSAFLTAALIVQMCGADIVAVKADTVSGSQNANLDFENGLTGWTTTGTVTVETGGQSGEKYVELAANSSITTTIKDVSQGSYTLSAWVKGTAGNNTSKITVSETGGPDSVAQIDTYLNADASVWTQMGHRNVLDYNGQMTITISSGTSKLDLDNLQLTLDSADNQAVTNWNFEGGLTGWTTTGAASEDTQNADTGEKSICLGAGAEIAQTVSVEPNTRYSVTMRAKVDKQDTFQTIKATSYLGAMGETEKRTSLGDRVNLGVRTAGGTVLRQAPSGTEDYGLVTITFTTGAADHEVVLYANTIYDDNYKDSVTIYKTDKTELADDWTGNGDDKAYVDNFDLFQIDDSNYLRGADVSFLPVIEDNGGSYFANGVQQDCLRILSNHGVNSITNMIFVQAGNQVYDPSTLKAIYHNWWLTETGEDYPQEMVSGGYFDKTHSLELGMRATELGMSYLPSFHYSDYWMSNAKAYTPEEWLNTDYEGNKSNSDLSHMQSVVYNYVYDFMKNLKDNDVNVIGVKHGNEQNGGIVWPVGMGATSVGHAALIAASYEATQDAMAGVIGFVHSNNGYTTTAASTMFDGLRTNGAKLDGAAFSLYGGRSSGNILTMANYMLSKDSLKYLDYVNVETGFTFTKYLATFNTQTGAMGQSAYYATSANGQYNWLLDYMQAPLDIPNPYGQTRGFYYWETDWIPTPGAASSAGGTADINARTMFNNGDTSIKEMGSSQPGKVGDMMDSMYAYLMRGCVKDKADTMQTPLKDYGTYSVKQTAPTGITLSKSDITLTEGAVERLQPTITPIDSVLTDSSITYASSDSSVASVTKTGFVCAKKAGTATITATVAGGYSASVTVTVTSAIKATDGNMTVSLDGTVITDGEQKTATVFNQLQLTTSLPETVSNRTVVYTSSNPDVASFFGETWQTPDGQMRQETEKDTKVQLNVKTKGQTTITVASADGGDTTSFVLDTTKVDVSSVTLDQSEASISYGKTLQLNATVLPKDTTLYKVNWESSDQSIATVDANGLVSTTGIGDAVIKAVSDDNATVYAVCTVHVLPVQVESISLDKDKLTIQSGTTKTLKALILPEDADNKNVTWTSSDSAIATVNEKGEVTGVAVGGPVTITATSVNGGFTASCAVTVQQDAIAVTGIALDQSEYYFSSDYFSDGKLLDTAPTFRLTATVEPDAATDTDVIWESDTPQVATVDAYGRVTALSSGVAKITATTKDGGFVATSNIYVPTVSESFDNRTTSDTWGTTVGSVGGGAMAGVVFAGDTGNVLKFTGSGSGGRSAQKKFATAISNDKIVADFDWNVGAPTYTNGCYLTLTDSNNKRYLSIQTNKAKELVYSVGGVPVSNTVLTDTQAVGTGFNQDNAWYHVNVVLNRATSKILFTITNKADSSITATHEISYDPATTYAGNLGAIQLYANRTGGTMTWTPQLDNVNIYSAAPVAKSLTLNTANVKLIPIDGTLGAKYQMSAQIAPTSAVQDIVWTSSDTTVAQVDASGLVTPAKLYTAIADVVPGTCTIRATSASDSSIYKEATVTISNSPNASENFSVQDEKGTSVYDAGSGSSTIELGVGVEKQYTAVVTGGDGATDIAAINWASSNPEVVSVDAATGKVTTETPGEATVTLTVTLYTGNPLTAELHFNITGVIPLKTTAIKNAISAAKDAKTYTDDYYSMESLQTYKTALAKAEGDLQTAATENWDNSKQPVLDDDVTKLNAAVTGLAKSNDIAVSSIEISGRSTPLSINKQVTYTAKITPDYATEQIKWQSSDPAVAKVNAITGEVTPIAAGTAVITAQGVKGTVKAEKTITVSSDLTSYYEDNGVTITATNTKTGNPATNPFINARTMKLNGSAWSTGSNATMGSVTVDLGAEARIDNVKSCFWQLMKYTLDVSDDGNTWTTVVDHSAACTGALSSGSEAFTDAFPENTVARYVRVNLSGIATATDWVGITALQVNGAYVLNEVTVADCSCPSVEVQAGTNLTADLLPATVTATLSNGETQDVPVVWNTLDIQKVATDIALREANGEYQIGGIITVDGNPYDVICKVNAQSSVKNLIQDSGFEKEDGGWKLEGDGNISNEGKRNGDFGARFQSDAPVSFTASQEVTVTDAGLYNAYAYINGSYGSSGSEGSDIYLSAVTKEGKEYISEKIVLTGSTTDWSHPRLTIRIPEGGTIVTLTIHVTAPAGTTGTLDDAGMYLDKGFTLKDHSLALSVGQNSDAVFADSAAAEGETIVWSSSNENCVKVSDGSIKAVGAGTAVVTASILGGDVTSTCTVTVAATDMSGATLTLDQDVYTYDGTAKQPVVTAVVLNGTTLSADDYTVSYSGNINAGTATVTVSGKGNYTGSVSKAFTINKALNQITLKKSAITKAYGAKAFSFDATALGGGKLSYKLSNKKVIKIVSGKATIVGYGKVTVTVTSAATANYQSATSKLTITVTPKITTLSSLKSSKKGQMSLNWKMDKTATGYMITYSTSKTFNGAKSVYVKSYKTTSQTISKLSKGKYYYVKMRAYKTVDGKKIYGEYSSVKKVKIKK